jgi:YidC/Oxa1 family membrane protein insertase
MDRNTTIGLVLLGLILTVFSVINQPSKEDYKKSKKNKTELSKNSKSAQEKDKTKVVSGNTGNDTPEFTAKPVANIKGEIIRIENEKLIVDLNTKGGLVSAVYLKEFKSYNDFSKKKNLPLCLFKDGDNRNQLVFPYKNGTFRSATHVFNILKKSQNSIVFELEL